MVELREIPIAEVGRQFQLRKRVPKDRGAEVIESIKRHGVIQPPRVDAKRQLLVGDMQLWGARAAGDKTIMVLVDGKEATEVDALRLILAEDAQSIPLKATEKRSGFNRLMELTQCSAIEAAESVGVSKASVSRLLATGGLEPVFQGLMDAGRLGVSKAYELTLMTPEERLALLPGLRNGELTRADLAAVRRAEKVEPNSGEASSVRIKIVLDGGQAVTVQAAGLEMGGYIEAIKTVLRKAQRAQSRGLVLRDFARSVRRETKTATP